MKCKKQNDLLLFPDSSPVGMLALETELWKLGYLAVAGVDEAGRGPLAGPVVAAAVILSPNFDPTGIDDSKRLSESARIAQYGRICEHSLACAVAAFDAREIERTNILAATKKAMCLALERLTVRPDFVLIDGNQKIPVETRQRTVVKGDRKSASIAAASILAKVTRDLVMGAFHFRWPQYDFAANKGYPTALHRELIQSYGPCLIHRRTFKGVKELQHFV